MSGSPRTRLSPLLFREHSANAKLVLGLIFIAATTVITPQIKAADWVPSVAGNIPTNPADTVRPLSVINREDIELSGMRNVYDLLNSGYGRGYFNNFGSFGRSWPEAAASRYLSADAAFRVRPLILKPCRYRASSVSRF